MVNEQKNQTSATKWRAFFVYLQKNDNYGTLHCITWELYR